LSLGKAIEVDRNRGLAARAATYLALIQAEQGRFDRAAESARRAVTWKDDDAQAWTQLGLAQQGLGDLAGARVSLEKAQALDPASAETLNNLGSVYYRASDFEGAGAFQRAVTMRPDFVAAADNLEHARRARRAGDARKAPRPASPPAPSPDPPPGCWSPRWAAPRPRRPAGRRCRLATASCAPTASRWGRRRLYALATRVPAPRSIALGWCAPGSRSESS
jgi:Flp pilus assembly protein TadD